MAPFRRRPASPTAIQILDDSPGAPERNQLPAPPAQRLPPVPQIAMDDLDEAQLNALLEREAESGTHTAHDVLRTALESRQVATATAEALDAQTKQLEAIADAVLDVDANVARAEVTVQKLVKSRLRRVAEKPLNVFSRDARKKKRVVERKVVKGKENVDDNVVVVAEQDLYEDFENEKVRGELRKQDELLDDAVVVLDDLRGLAIGIGEELEYEAVIVDSIDAPEVTGRIRATNRKIRRKLLS